MFLIINNAEKGISEFCEPIEKILHEAKIPCKTIEYQETLAADMGNLAFQVAHTGLPGVAANNRQQCPIAEVNLPTA